VDGEMGTVKPDGLDSTSNDDDPPRLASNSVAERIPHSTQESGIRALHIDKNRFERTSGPVETRHLTGFATPCVA